MIYRQSNHPGVVRRRFWALLVVLALLVGVFSYVLYDLQVLHGDEYFERSHRKIAKTETVDASRGDILDSLGQVLITNKIKYQVVIDLSLMGKAEQRNDTLLKLISLCRSLNVKWNDTLSITAQQPFQYTSEAPFFTVSTDDEGKETRSLTRLGKLAVAEKWISSPLEEDFDGDLPTADELLSSMFKSYGLDSSSLEDNRAVAGVLYELALRSKRSLGPLISLLRMLTSN